MPHNNSETEHKEHHLDFQGTALSYMLASSQGNTDDQIQNGVVKGISMQDVTKTSQPTQVSHQLDLPRKLREALLLREIRAINKKTERLKINDAKFKYHKQTYLLTKNSLGCLNEKKKLRKCLVWLVTWRWFENAILFCILFNSIVLMIYDYRAFHYNLPSSRNDFVEKSGYFFTGIFTLEFILKALALGFIMHRNAYLRDPWNWLDFIVVITGLLQFVPGIPNLKPLRVLRVFRPLRSIKTIESMRRLVSSLLKSLPKLGHVIVFLVFLFLLFGILGLQLFGTMQYNRCRTTPAPLADGTWPLDEDIQQVCRTGNYGYFECPAGLTCGNPEDHGLPRSVDNVGGNQNINYGITNFDNILAAMLTIFQLITLEGWAPMTYNYQDAMMPFVPAIYFCFLVVLGSFFLLNLILAVIMDSFQQIDSEKRKEKEEKRKRIQESLDSIMSIQPKFRRKKTMPRSLAFKRKQSLAAITSQGERESDKDHGVLTEQQPSFMNSTNTLMMKHCNQVSVQRNPNLSLGEDIEDLKEIHLAIKERGEISFSQNVDNENHRTQNPPPLCKNFKRRLEQRLTTSQAAPKSGEHTIQSQMETEVNFQRQFTQQFRSNSEENRRDPAHRESIFPLINESGVQESSNSDNEGLNDAVRQFSNQRSRNQISLQFSLSMQNEKPPSSNSIQNNINRSLNTIHFNPDPEPEPLIDGDSDPNKRFSRKGYHSSRSLVHPMMDPTTNRHPAPILPHVSSGRTIMSQESRNYSESSPSTPHRRRKLGEMIEIDDSRRRADSSLNHTRDEALYSEEEIEEEDQDDEDEEFEEEDEEHQDNSEDEQNSKEGREVVYLERGSSLESDSQNDPKQTSESQKIPAWSRKNKCNYCTYKLVKLPIFNFLVLLAILVNTVVLAMDRHPIPHDQFVALQNANLALYCFFLVEMILKLIGLGFKGYTKDSFNIFDGVIVILSTIEIIISYSFPNSFVEGGALSAFRGFRLLRVFKIARSWTSFQGLLRKIGQTLKDIWSFVILLLIVIFCFAMMGMEFFSFGAFYKYYDGSIMSYSGDINGQPPRLNFNNLLNSIILIFVVLSGQDWQVIMYDYYRPYGPSAAIFFICLVVIGNFIFLNLFLAILLKDFEDPENFKIKKKEEKKEVEEPVAPEDQQQRKLQNKARRNTFTSGWRSFTSKLKELITGKKSKKNVKRSGTSQALVTPRGSKRISLNEVRTANSARLGSLVSAEQTFQSNSPSPPGKTSDLRKLKRGRFSSSQEVKELPAPSEFSIIPMKIAQFKYSSLAGQSEASNGKQGEFPQRKITEEELYPKREQSQSRESGGASPIAESKYTDMMKGEGTKENSISEIRRGSVQGSWFRKHLSSKNAVKPRKSSNKSEDEEEEDDFQNLVKEETLENRILGKSLYMCGPKNKFRMCLAKIVTHKVFEAIIIILILASSISLAIQNPLDDPNGQKAYVLEIFDAVMTSIFCLEAAMKIIAFGFILGHKHTYLRNCWNVMDFIIVIFSIVSLSVGNSQTKALKAFRLLRVLRPLRVISKNEGLRLGVQSLIMSIPDILNVLVISLLFFLVFGIFSVNYFKGGFYYCQLTDKQVVPGVIMDIESQDYKYNPDPIFTRSDCLNNGGQWLNRDTNFDNCLNAILLLFEMSTTEGWVDVMYWGIQSRGIDKAPRQNNAPYWGLYFITIFVVGSLFIINLFVGVVIRKFQEMKQILGKNFLLTQSQKQWIQMKLLAFRYQPKKRIQQTLPKCRRRLYKITSSNAFEWFIMICIIINTALMAITWYGMSQSVNNVLDTINYVFAGIFTLEAILKIIALGRNYFCDGWNCFDFIIVSGTLISILIAQVSNFDIGTQATLVRSFRIGRIFRLIRRAKSLKMIFDTFIITIPSLTNVGVILLLLIYIYAILGVNMFATVKLQDELNRHANFQSFGTAFLLLMRVSTGEAWNSIMHDTVRQKSSNFDCVNNPSYSQIQQVGETNGCGNAFGYFYFCSFVVIVSFVYLNLFIAIILQGFSDTNERANLQINDQVYQDFRDLWSDYDKEGRGLIPVGKLPDFLNRLELPLGVPLEIRKDRILMGEWIGNLRIKSYQNFKYFHFWDVLQALIRETIIREKVKEAVIQERERRPDGEKETFIIDEQNVASQLQQQIAILEQNASKSKQARSWRNMIKTQRKINKRLNRYRPDNYGSEFIWAAKLIADFMRRRLLIRKMVKTYGTLKNVEDKESSHGENIGSISFEEVEFTNMVRNVSDRSLPNNNLSQSANRSVYSIPVHPVTPLSSEVRKLPRFNESWESQYRPSPLNLSQTPPLSQHNISTSAIRLLRAAHENSQQAQKPQSPQEKEQHLKFAQRFQFSPHNSNQNPVSPKFGYPGSQKNSQKMTFGMLPKEQQDLPDFAESLIHEQSPQIRCLQETPPPLMSDERAGGGDLSSEQRPSFWNSDLGRQEELKTQEDKSPHHLSVLPNEIGHVSFGEQDENVLETPVQGIRDQLKFNENIGANRQQWRNHAFEEPHGLQKQESLPPSMHDSALDESKQSGH